MPGELIAYRSLIQPDEEKKVRFGEPPKPTRQCVLAKNLQLTQPPLQFLFEASLALRCFRSVLLVAALAVHIDWTWNEDSHARRALFLPPRRTGGTVVRQSEEKWRDDPLGGVAENGTLAAKAAP